MGERVDKTALGSMSWLSAKCFAKVLTEDNARARERGLKPRLRSAAIQTRMSVARIRSKCAGVTGSPQWVARNARHPSTSRRYAFIVLSDAPFSATRVPSQTSSASRVAGDMAVSSTNVAWCVQKRRRKRTTDLPCVGLNLWGSSAPITSMPGKRPTPKSSRKQASERTQPAALP